MTLGPPQLLIHNVCLSVLNIKMLVFCRWKNIIDREKYDVCAVSDDENRGSS